MAGVLSALGQSQLVALFLQPLLDFTALLRDPIPLDTQQVYLPPNHGLPAQQRQQLPVIQHAVTGAVADQQSLQFDLLRFERDALAQQRLQLLPGTRNLQFIALAAQLTEGQQTATVGQWIHASSACNWAKA